jgi:hypothetical protein
MCNDVLVARRGGSKRAASGTRLRDAAFLLLALAGAMRGGDACADICKYIDPAGNIHYQNVAPERGWKKLGCSTTDDPTVRPGNGGTVARAAPTPQGFPRVDATTQRGRDDMRKKVLVDELAAEEKMLVESRTQYADGAPAPLPEERTDAERYRARIARLRQAVALHEKNIEALKKELAAIK